MVLVDTSVWSIAFRRSGRDLSPEQQATVHLLLRLASAGEAKMIGAVRQELLTGVRQQSQFEALRTKLRHFPDEALIEADYEFAAELSNRCTSRGIAVTDEDLLICAVSIRRSWSILTLDQDFSHYAAVLPIDLHPVG